MQFVKKKSEILGQIVNADGVAVDTKNVEVAQDWPVLKTKKDLESILGFANYHHGHVKQYAAVAAPLHELTGGRKISSGNKAIRKLLKN